MQARRALRHFPYWGGKIEHLILCCHSVKTFAAAKVLLFFQIRKEKEKKFGGVAPKRRQQGESGRWNTKKKKREKIPHQ